jgi:hypothetical protein
VFPPQPRYVAARTIPTALTSPTVAYSILQLPKSVIPKQFTQEELVALHRRCHQTSRRMQTRVYDPLELNHIR